MNAIKSVVGVIASFGVLVNSMPNVVVNPECLYTKQHEPKSNPSLLVPLYAAPLAVNGVCKSKAYIQAARGCRAVTAIVNLHSGPQVNDHEVSHFRPCLQLLQDHGVTVVGYIKTKLSTLNKVDYTWKQFGNRPMHEVSQDMDKWISNAWGFPAFKGFFLDEATNFHDSKNSTLFGVELDQVQFYRELVTMAKSKLPNAYVILNPASAVDLRIMVPDQLGYVPADAVISFEDHVRFWRPADDKCSLIQWNFRHGSFGPGPFCKFVPRADEVEPFKKLVQRRKIKAAAVVYNVPPTNIGREIKVAQDNGLKYIYFTNYRLVDNPYASITLYWEEILKILNQGEDSEGGVTPKPMDSCEEMLRDNRQGPFPQGCLLKWWKSQGCTEEGTHAPSPTIRWGYDMSLTAKQIIADYKQYAQMSKAGDFKYTKKCGSDRSIIVNCKNVQDTAKAPFPPGCLLEWWTDAGCTRAGYTTPNFSDQRWGSEHSTAKNVKDDMKNYAAKAKWNVGEYPASCGYKWNIKYICSQVADDVNAPFTPGCLLEWWKASGCSITGTSAPEVNQRKWYAPMTVKQIKEDMKNYAFMALKGKSGYPEKCGLHVPSVACRKLQGKQKGPFPNGCLQFWWRTAGCTVKGTKYPDFRQSFWWDRTMSAEQIQNDLKLYYQYAREQKTTYPGYCGLTA